MREIVEADPMTPVDGSLEIARVAAETGAHMHHCHVNSTSRRHVERVLRTLDDARREGSRVTVETYPYGAGSTDVGAFFLAPERLAAWDFTPSSVTVVEGGEVLTHARLVELRATAPQTPVIVSFLDEAVDLRLLEMSLAFPDAIVASDAMPVFWPDGSRDTSAWPLPGGGRTHPRTSGTFSKALRLMVGTGQWTWSEAFRRCSQLPAAVLASVPAARTKGHLGVGANADVVVIDPDAFGDLATYTDPTAPSTGVRHLLVGGEAVVRHGELVLDALPGRPLRAFDGCCERTRHGTFFLCAYSPTARRTQTVQMRTRLPAALAATFALSACGSTVQMSSSATPDQTGLGPAPSAATGAGAPGGAVPGGTGNVGGSSGGGPSSLGPGGTGRAPGGRQALAGGNSGGAGGGSTSAPLPSSAATGLGVSGKTITIGYSYSPDSSSLNAAIGASSFSQPDEQANMKALIDEVNAHGGIAGRKLVGVGHPYRVTSSDSGSSQDEAACQDWTVDHKVIAVLGSGLTTNLVDCLKKKGVLFVKAGKIVDADQTFLTQYPNEILLSTLSQDRIFRDQAQSLLQQGWYGGWSSANGSPGPTTKTGVITYDDTSFSRSLQHIILPALKAAGHPAASSDVIQVHFVEQNSDTAGTTAQIKNAVLKLQKDGVTHVVLGDDSAFIMEFFASNARTQNYYPRLGVTSGAAPYAAYQAGLVTAKQLNGMAGNGWLPSLDIPTDAAAKYTNSETTRCLDILKRRTGQQYTSTNAATIALGDCDAVFIFQKAINLASSLSPAGLLDGFNAIGSTYTSPTVGPTDVSARQHDTAVRAWDLNWVASCSCVQYSRERRVPAV